MMSMFGTYPGGMPADKTANFMNPKGNKEKKLSEHSKANPGSRIAILGGIA